MAFKLVVSDPNTRKSYQKEVSGEGIIGKKIGDKVEGAAAGLQGYELQITGGSDKDGFPMRRDFEGTGRKRILLSGAPGFHPKLGGQRKRKSIRGNTVSEDTAQVNTKVLKQGKEPLDKLFGGEEKKEVAEEKPEEKKEEAPEEEAKAGEKPSEEKPPEDEKPAEEPKEESETPAADAAEEEKPAEEEAPAGEKKEEAPAEKKEGKKD
jgi:small subunit ribosomal protein S6e